MSARNHTDPGGNDVLHRSKNLEPPHMGVLAIHVVRDDDDLNDIGINVLAKARR